MNHSVTHSHMQPPQPITPARQPRWQRSHVNQWIEDQHKDNLFSLKDANNERLTGQDREKDGKGRKSGGGGGERIDQYDIIYVEESERVDVQSSPATPFPSRSTKFLHTPTSLKRILRPSSPPHPSPPQPAPRSQTNSRNSIPVSFLPRILRSTPQDTPNTSKSRGHTRSTSLSILLNGHTPDNNDFDELNRPLVSPASPAATITKNRPSVMKHFSPPHAPSSLTVPTPAQPTWEEPPRPSLNSVRTYATSRTSTSEANGPRPHTSVTTASSLFSTPAAASSHSLWSNSQAPSSTRGSAPISDGPCDLPPSHPRSSGKLLNNGVIRVPLADKDPAPPKKVPNDSRPYVAYTPSAHSTFSAFVSSTRGRRYKKLVVSGIGVDEQRRFDGVRRWCESFGEVRCINRMQNGDLHVHFKDPQVADTVCRIRAKVYIAGAGSVSLSWYIGKR